MDLKRILPEYILSRLFLYFSAAAFFLFCKIFSDEITSPDLRIEKAFADVVSLNIGIDDEFVFKTINKIRLVQIRDFILLEIVKKKSRSGQFAEAEKALSKIGGIARIEIGKAYISAYETMRYGIETGRNHSKSALHNMFKNLLLYLDAKKKRQNKAEIFAKKMYIAAKSIPAGLLASHSDGINAEFRLADLPMENVEFWEITAPNRYDISQIDADYILENADKMPDYPKNLAKKNNVWRKYANFLRAHKKGTGFLDAAKNADSPLYRHSMVQIIDRVGRLYLKQNDASGAVRLVTETVKPECLNDSELMNTFGYSKMFARGAEILVLSGRDDLAQKVFFFSKNTDARFAVTGARISALGELGDFAAAEALFEKSNTFIFRLELYFNIFECRNY